MGRDMGKAMTVCLAVVQSAIGFVVVRRARRRRRAANLRNAFATPVAFVPAVRPPAIVPVAREGPEMLQVYRL